MSKDIEKHIEEIKGWTPAPLSMGAKCTTETMAAQEAAVAALRRTAEHDKVMKEGRRVELPCKQYTTVYYLLDKRVFVGWYLAQVGETTHLILQDRIGMGICWVADGAWFLTPQEAEAALGDGDGEGG